MKIDTTKCANCGKDAHCNKILSNNVNARELGVFETIICSKCKCKNCKKEKDPKNEL